MGMRAAKVAKRAKAVGPTLPGFGGPHPEWNGAGGFKPGNRYGDEGHAAKATSQGRLDFDAPAKPAEPAKSKPIPNVDRLLPEHQEYVRKMTDLHEDTIVRGARKSEKSPDQFRDEAARHFGEIVKSGDHYIRITRDALASVLKQGRFKSQFETKNSRGNYDPEIRKKVELESFGVPLATPDDQRPIYGYVASKDFGDFNTHRESGPNSYGEVAVRLNPEIRSRTTVSGEDSFGSVTGSPIDDIHPTSIGYRTATLHGIGAKTDVSTEEKLKSFLGHTSYIESQYHGGVSAKDIAEVAFSREPGDDIKDLLASHGIKHRVIPKMIYGPS